MLPLYKTGTNFILSVESILMLDGQMELLYFSYVRWLVIFMSIG